MRQLRILKQGAWYEIRTLVNNREPLFRRYTALAVFAEVFRQTELRFAFRVRGLRLEDDRLEFYIRPEDGLDLPAIMKRLKQSFAQRYNREDGRTGHIWGDRDWARLVEGEPPEEAEGTGGREEVSGAGVRPCGGGFGRRDPTLRRSDGGVRPRSGKNPGTPRFPPVFPFPAAPVPG
ncbi:MAG: transposase [Treponema sp.]|jgi:REP element-mobilizing transposase RayT|nr:transposase [Treponema sp.]